MTITSAPPLAPPRVTQFPVTYFGVVMGLAGLTVAWQAGHATFSLPGVVADGLLLASAVVFVVAIVVCGARVARERSEVLAALRHPRRIGVFSTISISLLLLAIALAEQQPLVSEVLWAVGALVQLGFTLQVVQAWTYRSDAPIAHIDPTWFLPVIGNLLVPVAGVAHGHVELSWFFFAVGAVSWLVLFTIVFNQVVFHSPLPVHLAPTLFVLAAPPAVGFVAYTELVGGLDSFGRVLYYGAVFSTLLLLTQLERFMHLDFTLSWWAYSFPMAAMTVASVVMYQRTGELVFELLAFAYLAVMSMLVVGLVLRTARAIITRERCVEPV